MSTKPGQDQVDYTSGSPVTFHLSLDHLGSPRLKTDSLGNPVQNWKYFPFGEEAMPAPQLGSILRFTGHERDQFNQTGAGDDSDYMHARSYSPETARFQSVDRGGMLFRRPSTLNRFQYAFGNPLARVDLDGRESAYFSTANPDERAAARSLVGRFGIPGAILGTRVAIAGEEAQRLTDKEFKIESPQQRRDNSPQNAFKHALWSCMATCSAGPVISTILLNAHETGDPNTTAEEHEFDFFNNKAGAARGSDPEVCAAPDGCLSAVRSDLAAGILRVSLEEEEAPVNADPTVPTKQENTP